MEITYCCPYWGCENDSAQNFVNKVLAASYSGIEIFLPASVEAFTKDFLKVLKNVRQQDADFIFIAQQITSVGKSTTVADCIGQMKKNLNELVAYQPSFINSHTGKDYFSFDDNCRIIEAALDISSKSGVRILHETHRGRFSYHAATLLPYLKKFPELELVGDFSHFCTVSESLLYDQEDILSQIIPQVSHIHARVGHEQAPQVSDPFAPEWQGHLTRFEGWWQQIVAHKQAKGRGKLTLTPEFGPAPYMPALPFTKQPIGNQWQINLAMMHRLKDILH